MLSVTNLRIFRLQKRLLGTACKDGIQNFANLQLLSEVITTDEEQAITKFLKPILARKRYEGNHWDDVIQQYKELEMGPNYKVPDHIKAIMTKVQGKIEESIGHSANFLSPHVIDLSAEGYIGPHIDSVKFSGGFVAGLSLQSTRIMALTYSTEDPGEAQSMHSKKPDAPLANEVPAGPANSTAVGPGSVVEDVCLESYSVDNEGITVTTKTATTNEDSAHRSIVRHTEPDGKTNLLPSLVELVLPPRSLYILRGPWRYHYNHAILGNAQVPHLVPPLLELPTQRTSVIFRDIKA